MKETEQPSQIQQTSGQPSKWDVALVTIAEREVRVIFPLRQPKEETVSADE